MSSEVALVVSSEVSLVVSSEVSLVVSSEEEELGFAGCEMQEDSPLSKKARLKSFNGVFFMPFIIRVL